MKKNNNLLLLAIAAVVFFIFIALAFITLFSGVLGGSGKTTHFENSESSGTGFGEDTNPTDIQTDKQSGDVMRLLKVTPYHGTNFALFYSYEGNYFTLYINPSNPSAGNAEFDGFLRQNGISNRSWIYDLRTVSVSPTPEP
jgi:hypothetical protein